MAFYIGNVGVWDASATDSLNCKGYAGVGSDGEYIYYTPFYNGSAYHGIVLRQKIYAVFKEAESWEAYDAGSVDGLITKGFFGNPIFDGQFMYFSPNNNGSVSGIVLRYDTTKPFKSATSWQAYDAGSVDGFTTKGFQGAVFDGQFLYFIPYNNGAYNGIVLRYDTTKPFKASGSWEAYDLGSLAGGAAKGYWGVVVVDNFIYFSPYKAAAAHGQILRYDITLPFKSAGAWTVFNAADVSANCKGFGFPCTDGRFIYFPNALYNLTLRYDTTLPFTDTASYATFDILDLSDDENAQHNACCMQGHYIAFAPSRYTILVYDLEKPFSDPGSWAERDVFYAEGLTEWGFIGTYSDPNYVYFAPYSRGSTYHGQVLRGRVDPCPAQAFPSPSEENLAEYMLDDGTPGGGYLSVSSSRVTAIGINSTTPSLLFQDYEKDCFDGFEITFDIKMSSLSNLLGWDGDASFCLFSLGNRHSAYDEYPSSSQDDPCVTFFAIWDDDGDFESLWIYLEKESTTGTGYEIAVGTIYYCTISRPDGGTTVTLKIYSNAERTILLATLTESGFASTQKWRFLYAMRGTGHASTEPQATYYLENLNVVSY